MFTAVEVVVFEIQKGWNVFLQTLTIQFLHNF